MNRAALTVALALAAGLLPALPVQVQAQAQAQAQLQPGALLGSLTRFGLNLGGRTVWGADQLMANVLQNPGLEPGLDGTLIIVGGADARQVDDDSPWFARAAGFWAGARYEVLSGAAAGTQGRVLDNSPARPGDGHEQLRLSPMPGGLQRGDVLALQGQQEVLPAPLWWTQGRVVSVAEPRPGSPGQRSLKLSALGAKGAALHHHLDALGARAGKLLPVQGRWRLSLWLRAPQGKAQLSLGFGRQGRPDWLTRSVEADARWQALTLEFEAQDEGPAGPLQLSLKLAQGELLLDDIELGPLAAGPGGFRPEVVETLRQLRPGYLRDWQGQLGDSLANRLAEPLARQPMRYRPGPNEQMFAYGLPEFIELCAAVGARPWLVLPATITPAEAQSLGTWLRGVWQRHRFEEIVVEHGNEHWNAIFRPAGIAQPRVLGEVADRAFAALRAGAGADLPLHRVLGAQYVNTHSGAQLLTASRHSEGIAVAPYFHYRQDRSESTERALQRAFDEDLQALLRWRELLQGRSRSLDVYELNFHTTSGDASPEQRHAVLEHPSAAGALLARRLMQSAQLGVRRQAVYSLAGYDTPITGEARQLVRLFGITRDLATASNWRPTGQALAELNAAFTADGEVRAAQCSGPACASLSAWAFGREARRQWFIVSSAREAQTLSLPCAATLTLRLPGQAVQSSTLACERGQARLQMPGWSWARVQH